MKDKGMQFVRKIVDFLKARLALDEDERDRKSLFEFKVLADNKFVFFWDV